MTSTSPSTRPPAAAIDTPPAATPSGATATRPGGRPLRVVRAKLRPAPSPSGLLRRPRLHSLIEDCTGTPLTLVLAPAGSGKTSLLACWAADTACPSAWLTLDEADREPAAFWAGIVAALQRLRPHCGEATLALLRQPGPRRAAVDALLDELESLPGEPAVLVLDNFHLVDGEPALVDLVSSFTEHLPSWLSVVLLTRRLPPMPLARLRGQGRLRELHFSELRFSAQESRDMLTLLLPDLAPAQTEQIVTRAEGWAAGLGLTALAERARRARPDEFAAGVADQAVGHYAWREILAAGRPEVVDLLAAAAVVPRVHVGLAAALSGRPDAHDLLAEAEAQGLFVHRIGDTDSYEIHALVRAALLAQLGRRSPARLEELRVAAADWYESQGDCVAAIEQWIASGRQRDLLRALASSAGRLYDSGCEATIHRAIRAIPMRIACADSGALMEYAWCHVLVDRTRFIRLVSQLPEWVALQGGGECSTARLRLLQSIAAAVSGDWTAGGSLAQSVVDDLPPDWWTDPLGRFAWNMIAREIALSERWDDAGTEVRDTTRALALDPDRFLAAQGTAALGLALAGHPVAALDRVARVRTASAARKTILRTELQLAEAIAHRESGHARQALGELQHIAQAPVTPLHYAQVLAHLELAESWLDHDELPAARRAFDAAVSQTEHEFTGPGGADWVARTGTRLAIAAGDAEQAAAWAEAASDPFWRGILVARVMLRNGEHDAALDVATAAEPRCPRHAVVRHLVCWRAGGRDGSHLTSAIEVAGRRGLVQTVASEGPQVVDAVEREAWRTTPAWLATLRLSPVPGRGGDPDGPGEPREGLTARELAVLRLLPSRLTQREIADHLAISQNTVKFHLKIIYRKLGARSRAEAVQRARTLALVGRHPGIVSSVKHLKRL